MIRLVSISADPQPSGSKQVHCNLLHSKAPIKRVNCTIEAASLQCCPKYEAVSYSWLDFEPENPLVVNGNQVLKVNPSLFACLHYLLAKQEKSGKKENLKL